MNLLSGATSFFKFRLAAEDGFGISVPMRGLRLGSNASLNIQASTSTTYYYFIVYRIVRF
jgi:hypothetical protein